MIKKLNKINLIIVASEFNSRVVSVLIDSAKEACNSYKGIKKNLKIYKVPGAFEIPGMVNCILKNSNPDIIITLGSIIRGETTHYDHVANNCSFGISQLSFNNDIPIIFGVLCTENLEQALLRAEKKGKEMIDTAIKTFYEYEKVKSN